jgi:hypothetical protein
MNQATFANQSILWYLKKCSKNSDMDSNFYVCACGHHKETAKFGSQFLNNLQILSVTVFEQLPIRQVVTNFDYKSLDEESHNRLLLFDL